MVHKKESPLTLMHFVGSLSVGGAEKVVSSIVKASNSSKINIYVLTFKGGPLEHEIAETGAHVIIKPFKWVLAPLWLLWAIKTLHSMRIDVLHTHLFTSDVLGRIAGRLAGVPVIVSTLHAPSTWKKSRRIRDRIKRYLDKLTANRLNDGLIAISDGVKSYQITIGGMRSSKIRVISNPVSMVDFKRDLSGRKAVRTELGFSEKDTLLVNVGSLKPIKGQQYLLKAVALLQLKNPDLKLMIVGDGHLRGELEKLSIALGVQKQVLFLGLRHDISRLLSAADIFVVSSLSEGISMAILEAMAMGLPVVATDVGGNKDIIQSDTTGILIRPADEKDLAIAVESLIDNPKKAREIGQRAFQYVRDHHESSRIASYIELFYRDLLRSKRSC